MYLQILKVRLTAVLTDTQCLMVGRTADLQILKVRLTAVRTDTQNRTDRCPHRFLGWN